MTTDLAPLEQLVLPHALSGRAGINRATTVHKQIAAEDDRAAILAWLQEFAASPQTWRCYRKEAERLLLWSLWVRDKPVSSLTREDMSAYQTFLADPQPSDHWCGPRRVRTHSDWRPFQGPLSEVSQAQALSILNALFSYLVEAGYLAGNPLGLMRKSLRQSAPSKPVERFFEQALWRALLAYVETLPNSSSRSITDYERIRYLLALFYLLGPRISEVAQHTMDSFQHTRGQWWWRVCGKGSKQASIPVNHDMLQALMRYRRFYGLPDLPLPKETTPLFLNHQGTQGVTANRIHRLLKRFFSQAADALQTQSPAFALKLRQASAHWLRHTCITHQTDTGIDLRFIQRAARHSSVATTTLYQHAEADQWHRSMQSHRLPVISEPQDA